MAVSRPLKPTFARVTGEFKPMFQESGITRFEHLASLTENEAEFFPDVPRNKFAQLIQSAKDVLSKDNDDCAGPVGAEEAGRDGSDDIERVRSKRVRRQPRPFWEAQGVPGSSGADSDAVLREALRRSKPAHAEEAGKDGSYDSERVRSKRVQREDQHAAQQAQEQADIDAAIRASIDTLQESQVKPNVPGASLRPQQQHAQKKLRHTAPVARNVEVSIGVLHGENAKAPQTTAAATCQANATDPAHAEEAGKDGSDDSERVRSKRVRRQPRPFWEAQGVPGSSGADSDAVLREALRRSKVDTGGSTTNTPFAASNSTNDGRFEGSRAGNRTRGSETHLNSDSGRKKRACELEQLMNASTDSTRWVPQFREFVLGVQPCACGKDFHQKGKLNCVDNPDCVWGLGAEQNKGVWAKFPQAIEAVPKPKEAMRKWLHGDEMLASRARYPVGLHNFGATCYVNSILQCLYMNRNFRSNLLALRREDEWSLDTCSATTGDQPASRRQRPRQRVVCEQLQKMFVFLQEGHAASFTPTDFINAARIDSSYQQDVSEFLKMMLSQIEKELRDTTQAKLIQKTFQGFQRHVTKCSRCGHLSARSAQKQAFYELQLFPAAEIDLEDSLRDLLAREQLTGDNRYFCERCESKEDAERFIELEELPDSLCIQLMRFQYDLQTLTKRKLHTKFHFPDRIDMSAFIAAENVGSHLFDLTGILVHTGPSANGGHYTAHIADPDQTAADGRKLWWRFNDSDVSPLELSELGQELEELKEPTQTKISRAKTRKTPSTDTAFSGNHMLSSTNAYMLIYHRRGLDLPQPAEVKADLMAQVEAKNEALKQSQEQYQNLVNEEQSKVDQRKAVYNKVWPTTSEESYGKEKPCSDLRWVHVDWLRSWVQGQATGPNDPVVGNGSLLCQHGKLNAAARGLKRVTSDHYAALVNELVDSDRHTPKSSNEFCHTCATATLKAHCEKQARIEANKKALKLLDNAASTPAFWVSRAWIKRWKHEAKQQCSKARSYDNSSVYAVDGVSPCSEADVGPMNSDIICMEHGNKGMRTDGTKRQAVSREVWELLVQHEGYMRPTMKPHTLKHKHPLCTACQQTTKLAKANQSDQSRRMKLERECLEKLFQKRTLDDPTAELKSGAELYAVSSSWVQRWRDSVAPKKGRQKQPAPPPGPLDNSKIVCAHGGHLKYDPMEELKGRGRYSGQNVCLLDGEEFQHLHSMYPGGEHPTLLLTDDLVCRECLEARQREEEINRVHFQNAAITSVISILAAVDRSCVRRVQRPALSQDSANLKNGGVNSTSSATKRPKRTSTIGGTRSRNAAFLVSNLGNDERISTFKWKLYEAALQQQDIEIFPNQMQLYCAGRSANCSRTWSILKMTSSSRICISFRLISPSHGCRCLISRLDDTVAEKTLFELEVKADSELELVVLDDVEGNFDDIGNAVDDNNTTDAVSERETGFADTIFASQ